MFLCAGGWSRSKVLSAPCTRWSGAWRTCSCVTLKFCGGTGTCGTVGKVFSPPELSVSVTAPPPCACRQTPHQTAVVIRLCFFKLGPVKTWLFRCAPPNQVLLQLYFSYKCGRTTCVAGWALQHQCGSFVFVIGSVEFPSESLQL